MARQEKVVNVIDGGKKKEFRIRQFSATQGERVKLKMLMLLGADTDISKLQLAQAENDPMSFASLILNALSSKPYDKIQEMLDEILSCISAITDGGIETELTPELVDGFIDETSTLMKLRGEVIKFNNFFHLSGQSVLSESPAPEVTIKRQK